MIEKIATRWELEQIYSLEDIADANEALDVWQEAQKRAQDRANSR